MMKKLFYIVTLLGATGLLVGVMAQEQTRQVTLVEDMVTVKRVPVPQLEFVAKEVISAEKSSSIVTVTSTTTSSAPEMQKVEKGASSGIKMPENIAHGPEVSRVEMTIFKLSVKNWSSFPEGLWQSSPNLPSCLFNNTATRAWVEIFASPGNKRLGGFCKIDNSEDLSRLWFSLDADQKLPKCVYLVMTDRKTRKKYTSNKICPSALAETSGKRALHRNEGWNFILPASKP